MSNTRRSLTAVTAFAALLSLAAPALAQFRYLPPGDLAPGSGRGRMDTMVYAPGIRFPIEAAPAYPNSQVYNAGGFMGPPGSQCAASNYAYPWRDNYCESRSWTMPMCPSGTGHQGQDIRPGTCRDNIHGAVATVAGTITNVGSYSVYLTAADGTRYDYLHMRSVAVAVGDRVTRGQRLGRVSNAFGGSSTTIHLHFNIRAFVRGFGTVYVPPYMSLVRAYEDLLGTPSCTPAMEVCDGRDNDCDGMTDEGVTNACGGCGDVADEVCDGRDNNCNRMIDEGGVCDLQSLTLVSSVDDAASTTDLDGDGRADVCGRGPDGVVCHLATPTGWTTRMFALPDLSDAAGWTDPSNSATVRMGDVTGDGLADLCARANAGIWCWPSTGTGFGPRIDGPALSDADGWNVVARYSTLRLADVNGDGRDDVCVRGETDFRCYPSTGTGFGPAIIGPSWSDANGFTAVRHYGTIRMGDINGDGRADVCARGNAGIACYLADAAGFPTRIMGPLWSDATGWDQMERWSTIRLVDVNGDDRADICGRSAAGFVCHLSEGMAFAASVITVAGLSDAAGWADHDNFATLRAGDVNGDGASDFCARSNAGIRCWLWNGTGFSTDVVGPPLSDAAGWNEPASYLTIRLADINGDRRADLCARGVDGLQCYPSTGTGFGEAITLEEFSDSLGWDDPRYYSTLRLAGPRCQRTERCGNGADDNCDGMVDEGCATGMDAGGRDGGDTGVRGGDGGVSAGDGGVNPPRMSGCGCRTTSADGHSTRRAMALALACLLAATRRRRTPRA